MNKRWMTRGFWVGLIVIGACVGLVGDLLAFSVGEIDVQSGANEPFRAEVPFLLESHERDRELEVMLGTPQDYQHEVLERASILEHMHIILSPDKRDTVRIFSNVPVTDETLDLLVLLRSGKLTIVRNFHVELLGTEAAAAQEIALVEPAVQHADPVPADPSAVLPPRPGALPESDIPATLPPVDAQHPIPEPVIPSTVPVVDAQLDTPELYGPIQRGETLYNIVSKLGAPRHQRWQAVVLLWRMNHGEFLRGNLHGLSVGTSLEVPLDFTDRLDVMDVAASQQIIDSQWQAWRRRQVTTAEQALATSADLEVEKEEPGPELYEEPVATPQTAETDVLPEEPIARPEVTEPVVPPEEPISVPQVAAAAPPPEEPVPDDSAAAVAPPQVVRLPTDETSSLVNTQELKLLLGNLEDRLLRRLAPVQESPGTAPFVSPTELQVSLQNLENRLTQRVEQMMAGEGSSLSQESSAQPRSAPIAPDGIEFIAGLPMPPVAHLLVLINVVLLVFGLTLGVRWWKQNTRGEA